MVFIYNWRCEHEPIYLGVPFGLLGDFFMKMEEK